MMGVRDWCALGVVVLIVFAVPAFGEIAQHFFGGAL